jgi:hypothetical protein
VLVRSNPAPFRLACTLLGTANALLLAAHGAPAAVLGLVCLDVFFWIAYGTLRPRLSDHVWRFHVLLLKYPAFVGLVAATLEPVMPLRLFVASLAIYACACAYECLHDRQLPWGAIS